MERIMNVKKYLENVKRCKLRTKKRLRCLRAREKDKLHKTPGLLETLILKVKPFFFLSGFRSKYKT